jgi:argininosuccinate synthase
MKEKVVLAYSGGLDTSIMIRWLVDTYDLDVICMCADLGQAEELEGLEAKAKSTGALKCYILDLREEFITDYIYPTLKAGAIYERKYLLGTSFGRPLIAKKMVEIAHKEGATYIAHGATGKGNDQVRMEVAVMALDPSLKIIAPWKDDKWTLHSREDCIDYAKEHGIPVVQTKEKIYSEDRNIWHISHEGGELEDPGTEPQDRVYSLSKTIEAASDKPEYIELTFEKGNPVALNGNPLGAVELLEKLNVIGSEHAVGQVDMVENRLVGIKSRGVYETPGGSIIYEAHRQLEQLVLDRDTMHYKDQIALRYADLVYDGKWFNQLRESLDGFVDKTQETVSGKVRLKLYKGNIRPAGVWSAESLYLEDLASFTNTDLYDQKDATGFIRLFGLPDKVRKLVSTRNS